MLEWTIAFMARCAEPVAAVAEIYRVLEFAVLRNDRLVIKSLINGRVANVALVSYHSAIRAKVLTVVAPETALCRAVSDVVLMRGPVGLHLREKVRRIEPANFRDRRIYRIALC